MGEGGITTGFRWGGGVAQLSPSPTPSVRSGSCWSHSLSLCRAQQRPRQSQTSGTKQHPQEKPPHPGVTRACAQRAGGLEPVEVTIPASQVGQDVREGMFPGQGEVPSRMQF